MKIIEARLAKQVSNAAKKRIVPDELIAKLNGEIRNTASNGKKACAFYWNVDIEPEFLEKFLTEVLSAGYDVEFCYTSPTASNACGVVVGWGTSRDIDEIFQDPSRDIYRQENNNGIYKL